jgi:hypothetical protein
MDLDGFKPQQKIATEIQKESKQQLKVPKV